MEQLLVIGEFFSGLGVFFLGVAALWFVSVHQGKKE
jgi:hypothetical protein